MSLQDAFDVFANRRREWLKLQARRARNEAHLASKETDVEAGTATEQEYYLVAEEGYKLRRQSELEDMQSRKQFADSVKEAYLLSNWTFDVVDGKIKVDVSVLEPNTDNQSVGSKVVQTIQFSAPVIVV